MELHERLAGLRRSRGLSLRQLRTRIEEQTGERMAVSYLSSLERTRGTPSLETLTRIASGYGLSVQELLEPVGRIEGRASPQLPPGLEDLKKHHPEITDDQLIQLSRLEYRGARPESLEEWEQIYGMLRVLLGPKVKD